MRVAALAADCKVLAAERLFEGMSIVGCSSGLTLGGIAGLTSVTGGSFAEVSTATSDVPSCVQKVSHSSVNT